MASPAWSDYQLLRDPVQSYAAQQQQSQTDYNEFPKSAGLQDFGATSEAHAYDIFDNMTNVTCDVCSQSIFAAHWHCTACNNGKFDICHNCFVDGKRCPCGAANGSVLQFIPGYGRRLVNPSNYHINSSGQHHLSSNSATPCSQHISRNINLPPLFSLHPPNAHLQEITSILAGLLPPNAKIHLPSENPRISSLYRQTHRTIGLEIPQPSVTWVPDPAAFQRWTQETYKPASERYRTLLVAIETLHKNLVTFAEESVNRSGLDSWRFLTPYLEPGDLIDLLELLHNRREKIYDSIHGLSTLHIDLNAAANSSIMLSASDWAKARHLDTWRTSSKHQTTTFFHHGRNARITAHADLIYRIASKAETTNKAAYEDVVAQLHRSVTTFFQAQHGQIQQPPRYTPQDRVILEIALTVLRCSRDARVHLVKQACATRSEALQQEQVHARLAVMAATTLEPLHPQQKALLQHQQNIIAGAEEEQRTAVRAIEADFSQRVEPVIMSVLKEMKALELATTTTTAPSSSSSSSFSSSSSTSSSSSSTSSCLSTPRLSLPTLNDAMRANAVTTIAEAETLGVGGGEGGSRSQTLLQVPPSWCQDMLTSQSMPTINSLDYFDTGNSQFYIPNTTTIIQGGGLEEAGGTGDESIFLRR